MKCNRQGDADAPTAAASATAWPSKSGCHRAGAVRRDAAGEHGLRRAPAGAGGRGGGARLASRRPRGLRDGDACWTRRTETTCTQRSDCQYVPPELRETGDEVDLAARGKLPRSSSWPTCAAASTATPRTATARHTRGDGGGRARAGLALPRHRRPLAERGLRRRAERGAVLRQRARSTLEPPPRQRAACSAASRPTSCSDGQLDYAGAGPRDVLEAMDYVIGSVHSQFRMAPEAMTARIRRAVSDPRLTCSAMRPAGCCSSGRLRRGRRRRH
jgi:hypothetical protein